VNRGLLLDTHPLLWWLAGDDVGQQATEVIADPSNLVAVSAASIWEITIKRQLGKLRFDGSPTDETQEAGFDLLAVTAVHAEVAGGLPGHHRDPFDRMLVAQAQAEGLTLVTRDPAFGAYDVRTMPC
jgi:PIN domain nuclease of toxin-antitoxin system